LNESIVNENGRPSQSLGENNKKILLKHGVKRPFFTIVKVEHHETITKEKQKKITSWQKDLYATGMPMPCTWRG